MAARNRFPGTLCETTTTNALMSAFDPKRTFRRFGFCASCATSVRNLVMTKIASQKRHCGSEEGKSTAPQSK